MEHLISTLGQTITEPCWTFCRALDTHGYGRFHLDGRFVASHRAYWEALRGEIPSGLQIDHLCRNRACMNPWHMELVTARQNRRRGRGVRLTESQVREIKRLYRSGDWGMKTLARKFVVDRNTIRNIVQRRPNQRGYVLWDDVEP